MQACQFGVSKLSRNQLYNKCPGDVSATAAGGVTSLSVYTHVRRLRETAYGCVYVADRPGHDGKQQQVIIKVLRQDASLPMRQEFSRQADILKTLRHANVLSLLGASKSAVDMRLVVEYMALGELSRYLRQLRRDQPCRLLTLAQQLRMCEHVASAMLYLSQRNYVHRDLAARNCLVSEDGVVKIADFALMRELGKGGVYRGRRGRHFRYGGSPYRVSLTMSLAAPRMCGVTAC